MKTVLFLQHASNFGGSAMSLLYTILELKAQLQGQFKISVAFAKPSLKLKEYYESFDIEIVDCAFIPTYEHTTALSFNWFNPFDILKAFKQQKSIKKAIESTTKLLEEVKPDIVHLNSVVLLGSAIACNKLGIDFFWHVREHPVKGFLGMRLRKISKALASLPKKVFFISQADLQAWGNPSNGILIYNFVDFNKYNYQKKPANLSIFNDLPSNTFNILFLGGVSKIKGGAYLMEALSILVKKFPEKRIMLLWAGGVYEEPTNFVYKCSKLFFKLTGKGPHSKKMEKIIQDNNLENHIIRVPFVKDVYNLFLMSNVLIFPAIRPHFARPIMEAFCMKMPALGSDIQGVKELFSSENDDWLFEPKNSTSIVSAFIRLFSQNQSEKTEKAFKYATKNFNQTIQVNKILSAYNSL